MQEEDELKHHHVNGYLKVNTNRFNINTISNYLSKHTEITKLELSYGIIHIDGLKELKNCTSVCMLTIIGKLENLEHIIDIADNNNIQEIHLQSCSIGDEGSKYIAESKTIKKLYVDNCEIGDEEQNILP
jgi:hypothetical protein